MRLSHTAHPNAAAHKHKLLITLTLPLLLAGCALGQWPEEKAACDKIKHEIAAMEDKFNITDQCKSYVRTKDQDETKYNEFKTLLYQAKTTMNSAKQLANSRPRGMDTIEPTKTKIETLSHNLDNVCSYVIQKHPELKKIAYKHAHQNLQKQIEAAQKIYQEADNCNLETTKEIKTFKWNIKAAKNLLKEPHNPHNKLQPAHLEISRANLERTTKIINELVTKHKKGTPEPDCA